MTKVKTILAEFCSPKDILAINRLGLLKKEERESQPIPWRHRLPNAERRELVKSEMRMSLRPSRSRVSSRDKVKAFQSAASPKDSRMGESLYNIHIRVDPFLSCSLSKIEREQSRLEASQKHHRQQFVSRSHSLTHEPLLLVEREPSQTVKTRAMLMRQHGVDPQVLLKPSFMRPLEAHAHTPSTLTTIDAFVAETRKKRNVWETAMDEVDPTKFRSAARPFTRLNNRELQQLKLGHALHKPRPDTITGTLFPQRSAPPTGQASSKQIRRSKLALEDDRRIAEESVFITQRLATDSVSQGPRRDKTLKGDQVSEQDSAPQGPRRDKTVKGDQISEQDGALQGPRRDKRLKGDQVSEQDGASQGPRRDKTLKGDQVSEQDGALGNSGLKTTKPLISSGGGAVNKTVTFAGLPPSPDGPRKSHNTKPSRPLAVATDRSMPAAYNAERSRPTSLTKERMDGSPNHTPQQAERCETKDDKNAFHHQEKAKEQGEKKMTFLNTLLEEPGSS